MGFFRQPKPRQFHHEPVYYNVRHERLRRDDSQQNREQRIHEAFSGSERHVRRYRQCVRGGSMLVGSGALAVIIIVLVLIWIYLSR